MNAYPAAAALALTMSVSACATAPGARAEAEAPAYVLVEENASIPFAQRNINSFRVGEDRSLILRTTGARFYRGTLDPLCGSDLRYAISIGLAAGQATFDRSGWVLIDGRRCQLRSLDEIEDPDPPRFEETGS